MNDLISLEKIAQWQKLKTLVLDSVSSPITKRVYNMALDEFNHRRSTRELDLRSLDRFRIGSGGSACSPR